MNKNNASVSQTPSKQKNIFLHKETLLIITAIATAIILLSVLFFSLWAYFKIGFVSLLAFILIVVTRRTDSWKMGLECYYFLTFILAYVFSPLFSLILCGLAILFVIKFFRPDELQGGITQILAMTGMAFTAGFLRGHFGLEITKTALLIMGISNFIFWDLFRFIVALKITPAHGVKLFVSWLTGAFANYLYYSTFAYPLFLFLLTI